MEFRLNRKSVFVLMLLLIVSAISIWIIEPTESKKIVGLGRETSFVEFGPFIYEHGKHEKFPESFVIQNDTGQSLQISKVRRSCGCIDELTYDNARLSPGMQSEIRFNVTPLGSVGAKKVNFLFEGERGEHFECRASLIAYPRIHLPHGQTWHLNIGDGFTKEFAIKTYGYEDSAMLEFVDARSTNGFIDIRITDTQNFVFRNNVQCRKSTIEICVSKQIPSGVANAGIVLHFEDPIKRVRVKKIVDLCVVVAGDLICDPSGVFIGARSSFSESIYVSRRDGDPFKLKTVRCTTDKIKINFDSDLVAGRHRIEISGDAAAFEGYLLEKLTVEAGEDSSSMVVNIAGILDIDSLGQGNAINN